MQLSLLGHDVQNWSVTVVHAVNMSTTRRRVELSYVAINGPLINKQTQETEKKTSPDNNHKKYHTPPKTVLFLNDKLIHDMETTLITIIYVGIIHDGRKTSPF